MRVYKRKPKNCQQVYDTPEAVRSYSCRGFWPVEQYLFDCYLSHPGTVLDIACAAGRISIPLAAHGEFRVIGFDISFNQVKEAAIATQDAKIGCYFMQCDMKSIALAKESVDYIFIAYTSLGALYELSDRERAVIEIARVLKPDGVAFISIWNRLWPGRWGIEWVKWIVFWLLRVLKRNPHASGNRVCWEEGGYVLWHYFWPWEAKSLFKKFGLHISAVIRFTGAWDKNRIISNTWWSRWFGEGLYFVLAKLN